jgi:hypothetical protein
MLTQRNNGGAFIPFYPITWKLYDLQKMCTEDEMCVQFFTTYFVQKCFTPIHI